MPSRGLLGQLAMAGRIDRLNLLEKTINVDAAAPSPGATHLHLLGELLRVHRKWIGRELNQIGTLAHLNRTEVMITADLIRRVDRMCAKGVVERDCLVGGMSSGIGGLTHPSL